MKKNLLLALSGFIAWWIAVMTTRWLAGLDFIPPRNGDLAFMFWLGWAVGAMAVVTFGETDL